MSFRTRSARLLAATILTAGIVGTATSAHALTPPAPHQQGPGSIAVPTDPTHPDHPTDPQGPDDLAIPEADPECHPLVASCDLTNPTDPTHPGGDDGSQDDTEVDDAVVARPTFTG